MQRSQPGPSEQRHQRREERKKEHQRMLPGEDEPSLPPPTEPIHAESNPKRNEPCSCGSGKKYKQCCGKPGGK